jgi:fucose permease
METDVPNSPKGLTQAVFLARILRASLVAQLLVGCIMSFPTASMDVLLKQLHWTEGNFGTTALIQGVFGLFGNLYANRRVKKDENYGTDLRVAMGLVLTGALLLYFWEVPMQLLSLQAYPKMRMIGSGFIGFGVGLLAIVNNTRALRSPSPATGLMLVAFTFTFSALLFPFLTSAHLASLSEFTTHNWKSMLFPVLAFVALNLFLPLPKTQSTEQPQSTDYPQKQTNELHAPNRNIAPWHLGVQLFFYMGVEINLSIGLTLFGIRTVGAPNSLARFAPSALWLGILMSRLVTTIAPLSASNFTKWTWKLALALCILLGILAGFQSSQTTLWLTLVVAIGFILGPFYGFVVGQASHLWTGANIARNAATIATYGSAGAVILPFLFGQITENYGIRIAFLFILAKALGLLASAFITRQISKRTPENSF